MLHKRQICRFLLLFLLAGLCLLTACGAGEGGETTPGAVSTTKTKETTQQIPYIAPVTGTHENKEGKSVQNPQAVIELADGGKIVLELYPEKAPNTVNNFLQLAKEGFYDGLLFHRVVDFAVQGGGFESVTKQKRLEYTIFGEFASNDFAQNDIGHKRGVISMARQGGNPPEAGYNTASSQFFILPMDYPYLDGDYAAFGKVLTGMEVVDRIAAAPTGSYPMPDWPQEDIRIKTIAVSTFGETYPAVEEYQAKD